MPGNRSTPLMCVVMMIATGLAYAQEGPVTKYWPLAKISFPMDVQQIASLNPRPTSIRFYAAPPSGKFELVANKKPDDLEQILDNADPRATPKRGFSFTAERSSEKEFAVQYEYGDGVLSPPTSRLTAQYRVQFLLEAPSITAKTTGANSIRWKVEDDYVVPSTIRLEGRYPGRTNWQFLKTGDLRAEDNFKWSNLPADETLEVRVFAKNLAGHDGRSSIMTLGANAGKAARAGDDIVRTPSVDSGTKTGPRTGSGFGAVEDLPTNRVKIEYIGTNKLMVKSKITHITRSGVKEAQLFVQHESSDWKKAGIPVVANFTQETADPTVKIEYVAPKDGIYRFIVQPMSGAGTKADDPRPNDPAQYIVFVDTTAPAIKLKSNRVTGGGLNGPLIEIEWEASDAMDNLLPDPITLQFSDDEKKTWKPIHGSKMIANSGRHTWEITDKQLWKFHVRATATDQAGNSKFDDTKDKEPILVDLDKPSGTVEKVDPNGEATIRKQAGLDQPSGGVFNAGSASNVPAAMPITNPTPIADKPAPGTGGRMPMFTPTKPEQPKVEQVKPPEAKPAEPEKKKISGEPDPMKLFDPAPTVALPGSPTLPGSIADTKAAGGLALPALPPIEKK